MDSNWSKIEAEKANIMTFLCFDFAPWVESDGTPESKSRFFLSVPTETDQKVFRVVMIDIIMDYVQFKSVS